MAKPFALACLVLLLVSACQTLPPAPGGNATGPDPPEPKTPKSYGPKVDDWRYAPAAADAEAARYSGVGAPGPMAPPMAQKAMASAGPGSLGFSTGGAKDIANFRENLKAGYLPLPTDVTYEGLFYDYYFETPPTDCDELFCPAYSTAVSKDPFSEEAEYFLAVGLDSNLDAAAFARKSLNLVVVLDISGSMSSPFDQYYYDRISGGPRPLTQEEEREARMTKIEIATDAVAALLGHLEPEDRFGMVLFNDAAEVAKPLRLVGETDLDEIRKHVLDIRADGGTQLSAGMEQGTELFDDLERESEGEASREGYESRIIFLTDAMPNMGETRDARLLQMLRENADDKIYTTFVGIGLDFNSELAEAITKVRGANYYTVHSPKEFKDRMDEGFDYMVTPLVFNLELELDAPGYTIEKVYGSPDADEATGTVMTVKTLFPSPKEEAAIKGGLVLLQLKRTGGEPEMRLKVTYEDRDGQKHESAKVLAFEEKDPDFFGNSGIRKGVLLSRYANLLKDWLGDQWRSQPLPPPGPEPFAKPFEPTVTRDTGIIIPEPIPVPELGRWERQSLPLTVSSHYEGLFKDFAGYIEKEMEAIGDDTLQQELDILEELAGGHHESKERDEIIE